MSINQIIKEKCENSLLFFTRYIFKENTGNKFEAAKFHETLANTLQKVNEGKIKRLIINVPPRYGKTEIAMRAAFKGMMDGKQVALLAPTTILCQQHLQTFMSRMKIMTRNAAQYCTRGRS